MAGGRNQRIKKTGAKALKVIAVIFIILFSLFLILYPYISNYVYEHEIGSIVETIEKQEVKNKDENIREIEKAAEYNRALADGNIVMADPFTQEISHEMEEEYYSLLNMTGDGVMGFIDIPCIDVSLPIYHGTSNEVLEKGIGHLQGTSLPIGGEGTHSVLTGHTGLNRAKLFSDLSDMEVGDMFFLSVMGEKLAYQVDSIVTVLPEETNQLVIEPGMDYCTLITCTPYGVNSHRLLVRGVRTEYVDETENPEVYVKKNKGSNWMREYLKSIIVSSIVFIILLTLLVIWKYRQYQKERKKRKQEFEEFKNLKI